MLHEAPAAAIPMLAALTGGGFLTGPDGREYPLVIPSVRTSDGVFNANRWSIGLESRNAATLGGSDPGWTGLYVASGMHAFGDPASGHGSLAPTEGRRRSPLLLGGASGRGSRAGKRRPWARFGRFSASPDGAYVVMAVRDTIGLTHLFEQDPNLDLLVSGVPPSGIEASGTPVARSGPEGCF